MPQRALLMLPLVALLATSCALSTNKEPREGEPLPPYDALEHDWVDDEGSASLSGDLFAKTRGGDVKIGAGSEIWLVPRDRHYAVYWANERMAVLWASVGTEQTSEDLDPSALRHARTVRADSQGTFVFEDLPPGDYWVYGVVTWIVPTRYGSEPQLADASRAITLADGESLEVSLQGGVDNDAYREE